MAAEEVKGAYQRARAAQSRRRNVIVLVGASFLSATLFTLAMFVTPYFQRPIAGRKLTALSRFIFESSDLVHEYLWYPVPVASLPLTLAIAGVVATYTGRWMFGELLVRLGLGSGALLIVLAFVGYLLALS